MTGSIQVVTLAQEPLRLQKAIFFPSEAAEADQPGSPASALLRPRQLTPLLSRSSDIFAELTASLVTQWDLTAVSIGEDHFITFI